MRTEHACLCTLAVLTTEVHEDPSFHAVLVTGVINKFADDQQTTFVRIFTVSLYAERM